MEEQKSLELFEDGKKYVKGTLQFMVFHNEQNMYSVARIRVKETNEELEDKSIVVTGHFPKIHPDETFTFFGYFIDHPKFGKQYQVEHFRKELPQTKDGVIQYLSSDLFKGIGKKTAENIVEVLGERAISKILEDRAILKKVPKLQAEKADLLYTTLMQHQGLEQVMISLSQYGFGPQLSTKIYQKYLEETLEVIENNPYQLVHDVEGIGFGRADELGRKMGISPQHPDRIRAGCQFILQQECLQEGHVYLLNDHLVQQTKQLLEENNQQEIQGVDISREIIHMDEEDLLVSNDDFVYLPSLYYAEKGLVSNIKRLKEANETFDEFPEAEFLKALGSLEERLHIDYAPSQKDAIQKALSSPIMILTGGPGTGKTTVIKGIVELYSELHGVSLNEKDYKKDDDFPIVLAAPTGRAAKRMSEATGLAAVTVHRLLGWNGGEGFDHNEDSPIGGRFLIVDEFSMVDIWLANQLFKSIPNDMQVLLVGDEDQLPSVGPGQVLRDLLEAKVLPTVELKDIYRQSEGSSIVELAHEIKKGHIGEDLKLPKKDRSFITCRQEQAAEIVKQVCENGMKKGYTAKDIQVLAPMYRGDAGIDRLNRMLQQLFNPFEDKKRQIKFGDVIYRKGDKVLQLVNIPEKNVFNGDIGEIVAIFYSKETEEKQDQIVIDFEGNEIILSKQDLNQITHAYCCSIHKSQGSEFPIVIMPIVKGYYRMLKRNLIYTGITRSKNFLILVGEVSAFKLGIERFDNGTRQTNLVEKLKETFGERSVSDEVGTSDFVEVEQDIEDLIPDESEMANLTPYDFMDE